MRHPLCIAAGAAVLPMFWRANKWGIIALAVGGAVLGTLYAVYLPQDQVLAERILSTGICVLLFVVALATFLSCRKGDNGQ